MSAAVIEHAFKAFSATKEIDQGAWLGLSTPDRPFCYSRAAGVSLGALALLCFATAPSSLG